MAMEWQDQGILVSAKRHGEGSAIVDVFTQNHGRHAGIVRGGGSRKMLPLLQPGAQIEVVWKARLPEHLGMYTVKHKFSRIGDLIQSRSKLAAFNAWISLVLFFLPEREPHEALYLFGMQHLARLLDDKNWYISHAKWELQMLTDLGYGLDISKCVVTGGTELLSYVSPKSGCAVSEIAAIGWESKLLALPEFFLDHHILDISSADFHDALTLTGYFLRTRALPNQRVLPKLPEARERLQQDIKNSSRVI